MAKFAFGILLVLSSFHLLAQGFIPNGDWRFENFNSQNHFISREILTLTTDEHGYLWTSSSGVQRFDGNRTVYFNSFDPGTGAIRDNYTSVISDNDGRIWVTSEGLCYYDEMSGRFVYVQPDVKHPVKAVNALFVQKNYIWFVCEYGLAKIDVRSMKISFTSLTNIVDPLCTYKLDDNELLVSSREKVYIYNIKKNTYSSGTLTYKHSLLKIFTVAKSSDAIYLGTNQGLFTFAGLDNILPAAGGIRDIDINDLQFLNQDKTKRYLFVATEGRGMKIYNTSTKRVEFSYVHDDNNPYSLPDNVISKFFLDSRGSLWVATGAGVSMLDFTNQQWKMRVLNKSSLNQVTINKITPDKYDSTVVWMASYTQGMVQVNWKTKQLLKVYNTDPRTRKIYDFVQVSRHKMLLVTQKKVIEWDPQTGILLQSKLPVPDSLALVYNIRRLIKVDDHTCYVTTNKGLFKYNLDNHRISIASAPGSQARDLLKYDLQDGFYDGGALWIASRNGLFHYDIANNRTDVFRGDGPDADYFFFDVTRSINNEIVCASGDGLSFFNKRSKTFRVVNLIADLLRPHCESVVTIGHTLWVGTEVGVLTYDLTTHRSSRAVQATSLMQFFPSSSFTVAGNDIVLGFSDGYAYFTPSLKDVVAPSDPVIERVYANNQPVLKGYPGQKSETEVVFNHLSNSIKIAFTAFLYTDPDHIKFRYRLKGADPNWLNADGERIANYAQLAPGSYTFYVQCGNKNGVWNNRPASFSFVIAPPFWETWWFRLMVILVTAFALYSLYRYRVKNILAIERIREKIASDFHDDIGAALSSISIFSEVADTQLEEKLPREQTREIISHISNQSRAMLDALDDIIWAVNPQNDHFYDLAVRMREFAIPLLEAKNIAFDINIQEDILNARVKMEARKNIFLVFKECINNTLKHSGCTRITVLIKRVNDQLEMVITDNGCGFDVNMPNNRNGIKNMRKRAAEINAVIAVTTRPGEGVTTRLLANIT